MSEQTSCPEPRTVGPITQTDVVRFAGAGGDFNPLHHDPEAAKRAGFDRPIAMGQFTAALLAAWLTDWCGVEHLRELEVRFTAPLHLGTIIELSGTVVATGEDDVTLEVAARKGDDVLVTGRARVDRVAATGGRERP